MKKDKKWAKPKLIVLIKGRPEEAILTTCKASGVSGSVYVNGDCQNNNDFEGSGSSGCGGCESSANT